MNKHHYVAKEKGGPEVLSWQAFEPAAPGKGEISVSVETAGVLLADVLWQMGITPIGPKPPFTPGYDIVGTIEAVGPGVSGLQVGQRVAALLQYGGYTQHAVIPVKKAEPVPDGVDSQTAVAATTSYLTAYMLIVREGGLKQGDVLLVHGAGGGTGSALVEVASHMGIRVYGTASVEKFDLVRANGGTPIDYKMQDFVEVMRAGEPEGVDLVVDPIGSDVTTRSLKLLNKGGVLVSTAMIQSMQGAGVPIPLQLLRLSLWSLTHPGKKAYFWDVVGAAGKDWAQYRTDLAAVFDLLAAGHLSPKIDRVLPLQEAPQAQQLLLDYAAKGKNVLDCA